MKNPKIIFMGTPDFAVPSLEILHKNFGIRAVVTIPDKPKGRGLKLTPSPVKIKAEELNIEFLQPEKLNDEDFINYIQQIDPDIIVVIAFRILPRELYSLAKIASFNIHGSILPKYRGAAPVNHAIINGEKESGVTSFILQEKVDTGNILLVKKININEEMTAGELHDLLMPMAAELAVDTVKLLLSGNHVPSRQDDNLASPAPKLNNENTLIDWTKSSEHIVNFIRGLSPYPAAWTYFNGEKLKILKAKKTDLKSDTPGTFLITDKNFYVAASDYIVDLTLIQPANKKLMTKNDFLNGYRGSPNGMMK